MIKKYTLYTIVLLTILSATKVSATDDSYDISFGVVGRDVSINLNSSTIEAVYNYSNSENPGSFEEWFEAVDTSGIANWTAIAGLNINATGDDAPQFDYGWGYYEPTDHTLRGDSIFVLKLKDGSYKKIFFVGRFYDEGTYSSGQYEFYYADLDGSNYVKDSVAFNSETTEANYKLIETWHFDFSVVGRGVAISLNPDMISSVYTYANSENPGTFKEWFDAVDTSGIANWTAIADLDINATGDDAPQFDYGWGYYEPTDHTLRGDSIFVIELKDGSFKKVFFSGRFYDEGTYSSGQYEFYYADLNGENYVEDSVAFNATTTNGQYTLLLKAEEEEEVETALFSNQSHFNNYISVYPNPAMQNQASFIQLEESISNSTSRVSIQSVNGQYYSQLNSTAGSTIALPNLEKGMYIISVETNGNSYSKKLIIQ